MRTVVVLAEAAEDIEQAREFYAAQEPGIGDYCADSLVADIESLALYRGIHSRHFGIYYRETKTETQIIAVLDLRRDPNWVRKELSWRG
jgi:hypothetical protein